MTGKTCLAFAAMIVAGALMTPAAGAADIATLTQECAHCHGKDGASSDSKVPIIAGISELYMTDNLAVYKEQGRPCVESEYLEGPEKGNKTDMCKIANELSDEDIEALGKFYAAKPFVPAQQEFDAALAAEGMKIHEHNCEKCHEDGGRSAEDDAGILAGQWTPYLKQTFEAYAAGKREMPKKMQPKFEKLDDSEKEALLHYYASLK